MANQTIDNLQIMKWNGRETADPSVGPNQAGYAGSSSVHGKGKSDVPQAKLLMSERTKRIF